MLNSIINLLKYFHFFIGTWFFFLCNLLIFIINACWWIVFSEKLISFKKSKFYFEIYDAGCAPYICIFIPVSIIFNALNWIALQFTDVDMSSFLFKSCLLIIFIFYLIYDLFSDDNKIEINEEDMENDVFINKLVHVPKFIFFMHSLGLFLFTIFNFYVTAKYLKS